MRISRGNHAPPPDSAHPACHTARALRPGKPGALQRHRGTYPHTACATKPDARAFPTPALTPYEARERINYAMAVVA
jgi:hypothetical protein